MPGQHEQEPVNFVPPLPGWALNSSAGKRRRFFGSIVMNHCRWASVSGNSGPVRENTTKDFNLPPAPLRLSKTSRLPAGIGAIRQNRMDEQRDFRYRRTLRRV